MEQQIKGGRSAPLNRAIKSLFFTTVRMNLDLRILYVASQDNPADAPSRRLSSSDCQLDSALWDTVQRLFGGLTGHSYDLMALDSNAMRDLNGNPLPHFTPWPSPASAGVNFFAQVSSLSSSPYSWSCVTSSSSLQSFVHICYFRRLPQKVLVAGITVLYYSCD